MPKRLKLPRLISPKAFITPFLDLPKAVKGPMARISVVFGLLLAVGSWQSEFVYHAIMSNVYLNLAIWGTFFFGVVLTYRNMLRMKNEDLAFRALREMYEDAKNLRMGRVTDPMWRHYRCNELAVVFDKPEVLGHAYQLISEELANGKDVHVTTGTMQTLIDSIQLRLDERRSLTQYISGILILLGLIGTFIGLMETLASVGKILGELDISGADPTGAIAKLLANLQIPLRGMSVGFSASLFGAITSLVLSMMVRFSAMAFSEFTQDFEGWLANIVQIDGEGEITGSSVSNLMEAKQLNLVLRAARISVSSNARLNAQLDALSTNMVELARVTAGQTHAVQSVLGGIGELQEQGRILGQAMARNLETIRSVSVNLDAKSEIVEATHSLSRQLEARDHALAQSLSTLDQTLTVLRQRDAEAALLPTPQANEAFRLLEELKASLLTGELGKVRDRLWNDDDAPVEANMMSTAAARQG
ncbi:hypothetical protein [uncultured Devosia sp.]|uniref:hypothetical protein n=1 Tax=uncultured Devosia sp. TaxID=211434 RepID=UPI0035CC6FCB